MVAVRQFLAIILVIVLVGLGGKSFFSPEDASRNSRVDLQDAILLVRDFERTAQECVSLTANMEKMISTFHIMAGLKENIKPPADGKTISSDHFPAIRPFCSFHFILPVNTLKLAQYMDSRTIEPEPRDAVPRWV